MCAEISEAGGPEPQRDGSPERTYRQFVEALNHRDLDAAEMAVDTERWREVCVGFTSGTIRWQESRKSMEAVWRGLPDLVFDITSVVAHGDQVVALGTARATNRGRLFGIPATGRSYEASMFDYVRVQDGRIVDRLQQADLFGQIRQLYGRALILLLAAASVVLLAVGFGIAALILR
jgi:predicted ester cyclase